MRARLLVSFVTAVMTLAVASPASADPPYTNVTDTMPGDQYQLCVSRGIQQGGGATAVAGSFSVPRRTRTIRATIAVAGIETVTPLELAIQGNTTVDTGGSLVQWPNQPNDADVLTTTTVTPAAVVANPCFAGQIVTVDFPRASTALVPGGIYWLVVRTPADSTGAVAWYAAQSSQINTATASEFGQHYIDGTLKWMWYSYMPGLYVPNAFRIETHP